MGGGGGPEVCKRASGSHALASGAVIVKKRTPESARLQPVPRGRSLGHGHANARSGPRGVASEGQQLVRELPLVVVGGEAFDWRARARGHAGVHGGHQAGVCAAGQGQARVHGESSDSGNEAIGSGSRLCSGGAEDWRTVQSGPPTTGGQPRCIQRLAASTGVQQRLPENLPGSPVRTTAWGASKITSSPGRKLRVAARYVPRTSAGVHVTSPEPARTMRTPLLLGMAGTRGQWSWRLCLDPGFSGSAGVAVCCACIRRPSCVPSQPGSSPVYRWRDHFCVRKTVTTTGNHTNDLLWPGLAGRPAPPAETVDTRDPHQNDYETGRLCLA